MYGSSDNYDDERCSNCGSYPVIGPPGCCSGSQPEEPSTGPALYEHEAFVYSAGSSYRAKNTSSTRSLGKLTKTMSSTFGRSLAKVKVETAKAVLLDFFDGTGAWVPKSLFKWKKDPERNDLVDLTEAEVARFYKYAQVELR